MEDVFQQFQKGRSEEDGIPDVDEEKDEEDDIIHETLFTFELYGTSAFCVLPLTHFQITHTLLIYLVCYRNFVSSENMRRVVGLHSTGKLSRQKQKVNSSSRFSSYIVSLTCVAPPPFKVF